jgi:hypothetical protein
MPASPAAEASSPASSTLRGELRTKVRERGLVVWLDAEGQYSPFVDSLDLPYPIVRLRGSYLELMLALEPYANGLLPEHVLVHLPGLNKESVKETPVYELYKAGVVFEKNLVTLVREAAVGIATPDELDAFVRTPGLTLQKADEWLESLRSQPTDKLSLLLSSLGVDDVVIGLITEDPRLRAHLPQGEDAVLAFLQKKPRPERRLATVPHRRQRALLHRRVRPHRELAHGRADQAPPGAPVRVRLRQWYGVHRVGRVAPALTVVSDTTFIDPAYAA